MRTQDEIENNTRAYVRCRGDSVPGHCCGMVALTEDEYLKQLSRPDSLWCCPNCGSTAIYNDAESERVQGVNDDEAVSA